MRKFDRKNFTSAVFDLDGTLLLDGLMTEGVAEAVEELRAAGIKTAINSGRDLSQISKELRDRFDYTIVANGAGVLDNRSGEYIFDSEFSFELTSEVNDIVRAHGGNMFCFMKKFILCVESIMELMIKCLPLGEQRAFRLTPEFGDVNVELCTDIMTWFKEHKERPCKFYALFPETEQWDQAADELEKTGRLNVLRIRPGTLEIVPAGISKAAAIAKIDDPEKTVAFGDGTNDIEMLRASGFGVAMINGTDEVKAAADYIAPDVKEDGAATAIRDLFLN